MRTVPSYSSDEELLRRLQDILKDPGSRVIPESLGAEAKELAEELAVRIFDEPEKWGIDRIPSNFRNDAVQDTFMRMATGVSPLRGRQSAPNWFAEAVEERFRILWSLRHSVAPEPSKPASSGKPNRFSVSREFSEGDGAWKRFEREFPTDTLVLSLRYMQRLSLRDVAARLGEPSAKIAETKIAYARRRFIMFCETNGYDRKQVASLLKRFQEE
jgi:hypothetical protein